jgi:hypothetical protein
MAAHGIFTASPTIQFLVELCSVPTSDESVGDLLLFHKETRRMWILSVASRGSKVSLHSGDRLSKERHDRNVGVLVKAMAGVAVL